MRLNKIFFQISDRPGLRNPELLMRIQNKLKMVLSSILLPQHPENESIFPELMTMIHDLRTLNTLHTEKFLQQCKINENVPSSMAANSSSSSSNEYDVANQRWDSVHLDRESTGNGSPQSSSGGDTHSSTSLEDTSSRRSPLGSVSSTDSNTSSEVCKLLNVQDLRMTNNNPSGVASASAASVAAVANSVLMNALTSQAMAASQQKRPQASGPPTSTITTASQAASKFCKKTPSSADSDSGVEMSLHHHHGHHPQSSASNSTNNSLCSSPRSSLESLEDRSAASNGSKKSSQASPPGQAQQVNEERHPLLKRALQQPPQLFNNGTASVTSFQDEVYKPHKKFRRHNSSFSKDDCPTSSTRSHSPLPASASENRTSLLASQLEQPPSCYSASNSSSSLLASTLSQGINLASEESKRNEILAQLILDGNRSKQRNLTQQPGSSSAGQQAGQGLLMCAPAGPQAASSSKHIPVASLPQKPNRCPLASSATSTVTSAASAASNAANPSTSSSSTLQPLNLSKRMSTSNLTSKKASEAAPTDEAKA